MMHARAIRPTKKAIIAEAEAIERSANENLEAWVLSGHIDRYEYAMATARALRHALTLRTIRERKEYLNGALDYGYR